MKNRTIITAVAGTIALSLSAACGNLGGSAADTGADADYPTETISITVPYSAGGPNDVVARALAPCLGKTLGGTVIVENVDGGGGGIGTTKAAQAKPDGYTLLLAPPKGSLVLLPLTQELAYSLEDFAPIAETYYAPSALFVLADSPHQTAEDLIKAATAKPESVTIGTSGAGTAFDLELKHFREKYDVPVKPVPFKGGAEAQAALLGGHVDGLYALASQNRVAALESGELRALATGATEPVDFLPKIPTFTELGYPDLINTGASFVLAGPAGLPEPIRSKLTSATEECLTNDAVVKAIGSRYIPQEVPTGDALMSELKQTEKNLSILVD